MIRKYKEDDIKAVLDIWLTASIKAHDFVDIEFWESQVDNMRNLYIPVSETYILEKESEIVGFYSLHENMIAAIFVSPVHQNMGLGKQLLNHAKSQRKELVLSVYKENQASVDFYHSQGFSIISEQIDDHTGHLEYTMSTKG